MTFSSNTHSFRSEVTIAAPLDWVWWAWTRSDRITAWFAPLANVEPRLGGPFELFFDPANQDHMCTKGCRIIALEPRKHLGFTWRGPDQFDELMNRPDALTTVSVQFVEADGATRVVVEHEGWGDGEAWDEARKWHVVAWEQVLGSLKSALETGKGELCCAPEENVS